MVSQVKVPASLAAQLTEVRARVGSLRAAVGTELEAAFDDLMERYGVLTADAERVLHPLGQPLVQLPVWAARGCARATGAAVAQSAIDDMIEAAVVGYLHVRVQDDLVDEGKGSTADIFLSDAFLVRHQSLVARTVGGSERFWTYFEEVAFAYGDAMVLEERLHRADSELDAAAFDRILNRSRPLILPSAALFEIAGCHDDLPQLEALVFRVTRAGQLVDDLLDCMLDLDNGNHTWVVRRLGGGDGKEVLASRLLTGGLEEVLTDVDADLAEARRLAAGLRMDEAREWIEHRVEAVGELPGKMIGGILSGP